MHLTLLNYTLKVRMGISLLVQRLRICRAIQGMQAQSLVQELRSHMPQSNSAYAPQPSLHTATKRPHTLQRRPDAAKLKKKKKLVKMVNFTLCIFYNFYMLSFSGSVFAKPSEDSVTYSKSFYKHL